MSLPGPFLFVRNPEIVMICIPTWIFMIVLFLFACVFIYALAMHLVARGASQAIDGITRAFRR